MPPQANDSTISQEPAAGEVSPPCAAFAPIKLGTLISSPVYQYRIIHQLGEGSYASVWLAKMYKGGKYVQFVAMKIVATNTRETNELNVIRHVEGHRKLALANSASKPVHPGMKYVLRTYDIFNITSKFGKHQVIVSEPQGPAMYDLCFGCYRNISVYLTNEARLRIVSQIAKATAYLHSIGIIHNDLHSNNMLLHIPGMGRWTDEEFHNLYGSQTDSRPSSSHPHLNSAAIGAILNDHRFPVEIRLSDFGEAKFPSSSCFVPATSRRYAAPEVFFREEHKITKSSDVWSLGCTIYEILGDRSLFEPLLYGDNRSTIWDIFWALREESFPKYWKGTILTYEDGTSVLPSKPPRWEKDNGYSLQTRVETIIEPLNWRRDRYGPRELEIFQVLFREIFKLKPTSRLTANMVVEWLSALESCPTTEVLSVRHTPAHPEPGSEPVAGISKHVSFLLEKQPKPQYPHTPKHTSTSSMSHLKMTDDTKGTIQAQTASRCGESLVTTTD